jgi:carbon dioxide concentrating mechanism protein CcmO
VADVADAIGMIEVEGVAGIILGADAAVKAADVTLMGWESIGGFTTLFVQGATGDVDTALEAGAAAAEQVVGHVVRAAMHQPQQETAEFIGFPLLEGAQIEQQALGLLETRGYGAHVATNDLMLKAASVQIANVLTVHNRVVCTLVTGAVDDVEQAIAAGRQSLSDSEWFMGAAVITHPESAVVAAFVQTPAGDGAS